MNYLEEILENGDENCFPGVKETYLIRYKSTCEALKPLQEKAVAGALLADIKEKIKKEENFDYSELVYLNDHGPDHIRCVVDRCSHLLKENECDISGYEAYILLVAINLHDVGNIGGRKDHEKRIFSHIKELGLILGNDTAEKQMIGRIAAVHGGTIAGSKDTIAKLRPIEHILGKEVYPRFLAALVRFSDELADDHTRAARYELLNDKIPKYSEIFHRYSESLNSVTIKKGEIILAYGISSDIGIKRFPNNEENSYLIDEIYIRLLKMHKERVYCMRHLRERFEIKNLDFRIIVDHPNDPLETAIEITGLIEESGYPEEPINGLHSLCSSIAGKEGVDINTLIEEAKK